MSSAGSDKGGTVYQGSGPTTTQGTVYGAPPPPPGGTVYNGGTLYDGGTVYNGGAVYNGTAPAATSSYAPPKPVSSDPVVRKGVSVFFAIAIVTAIRAVLVYSGVSFLTTPGEAAGDGTGPMVILAANLVVSGIFLALGFWARSGSKAAFVIGMLLYGLDLVLMLINPLGHIAGIVVHGLFLYYLWNGFRQLP